MAFDMKKYQAEYYQRNKDRLNSYKKKYDRDVTRVDNKKFGAYIDRDLMEKFEKKLRKDGITKSDFLRDKIIEYLKN